MAWRNLIVQNALEVTCKDNQLVSSGLEGVHSVPLEDINSVLFENKTTRVSVAVLVQLAAHNVTVYFCDDKHLPAAVLLPYAQHSSHVGVVRMQEAVSLPTQKRLWQQIVIAKINNQGRCLEMLDLIEAASHLYALAKTVTSGDSTNVEATAAAYYFPALFGKDFVRDNDGDPVNAALNYGYAILRGHIARTLVSYGLLPIRGLHHHNAHNSFNLADDLIEAFRPVVDLYVATSEFAETGLTSDLKHRLVNILNLDIGSGGQMHSVAFAVERLVQSLTRCYADADKKLLLPVLMTLRQHRYE